MLLLLDNYDSFTYNLMQYFEALGQDVVVHRSDALTLEDITRLQPDYLCLSSGPGRPEQAGIALDCVRHFAGQIPILGVAQGHQVIAQAFGAQLRPAAQIMHGKTTAIVHQGQGLFAGLPSPFEATCYHALIVDEQQLPAELEIIARDEAGQIMALQHQHFAIHGVQFHPESIFTEQGEQLLQNFLHLRQSTKEK